MSGSPLEIHFRPDVKPIAHHNPIPIPCHWKEKVKANLARDIQPVPHGNPTIWCSRTLVVSRKDGSPYHMVDLQLQTLQRTESPTTHECHFVRNQVGMPANSWMTTLNLYHSMHRNPKATTATTFVTEWGRHRNLLPHKGSCVAGDS